MKVASTFCASATILLFALCILNHSADAGDIWSSPGDASLSASSKSDWTFNVQKVLTSYNYWKITGTSGWIQFNFPSAVTVSGFRTKTWPKVAFKKFKFEKSNDNGASWQAVLEGEGQNKRYVDTWQEFVFDPVSSKMFRLNILGNWGGRYLYMKQLELRIRRGPCGDGVATATTYCQCGAAATCKEGERCLDGRCSGCGLGYDGNYYKGASITLKETKDAGQIKNTNDRIQSLKVGNGFTLRGYQDSNFKGKFRDFIGSVSKLGDFDNKLTSWKCVVRDSCGNGAATKDCQCGAETCKKGESCSNGQCSGMWSNYVDASLSASSTASNPSNLFRVTQIRTSYSYWSSKTTSGWIQFSFPSTVTVSGFRTKSWKDSTYKKFRFEKSKDNGASWQLVLEGEGENQLNIDEWQEFIFDPVSSNMFRLNISGNWGATKLYVKQLELRVPRG